MARRKRGTPEQQARRALISELLSAANVQSMDDIQNLFKETIAEFMEGSLESELDVFCFIDIYAMLLPQFLKALDSNWQKPDCIPHGIASCSFQFLFDVCIIHYSDKNKPD